MQLNVLCQNDIEYEGSFGNKPIFSTFSEVCATIPNFLSELICMYYQLQYFDPEYTLTQISVTKPSEHHPLGNPQLVTPHNPTPMLKSFMVFSFIWS